MRKPTTTFDHAISVVSTLSPLDKVRLMERLALMLEHDLSGAAGELSEARPMTLQELVGWLDANLPDEPWGDLRDDEDAGEYIHRMRRQTVVSLDEPPGEVE
jgi:hypothetical protein